jgi:hypothetical protein
MHKRSAATFAWTKYERDQKKDRIPAFRNHGLLLHRFFDSSVPPQFCTASQHTGARSPVTNNRRSCQLKSWFLIGSASSHFGSTTITATHITRLFVEFTLAHFLFDSGMFDQLPESTYSLIHALIITQTQFNHKQPPSGCTRAQ